MDFVEGVFLVLSLSARNAKKGCQPANPETAAH